MSIAGKTRATVTVWIRRQPKSVRAMLSTRPFMTCRGEEDLVIRSSAKEITSSAFDPGLAGTTNRAWTPSRMIPLVVDTDLAE
jgi:hypothetical protein